MVYSGFTMKASKLYALYLVLNDREYAQVTQPETLAQTWRTLRRYRRHNKRDTYVIHGGVS